MKAFDGRTGALLQSFYAYDPSYAGGVSVVGGSFNANGYRDMVTGAGPGGGPHVKVFDDLTGDLLLSFYPFDAGFLGGVAVG